MKYLNYEDMANSIRRNLWKVPADTDLIVGIPRSGMIPALMIAEFLNKRVTDIDSFISGRVLKGGFRESLAPQHNFKKVLVIDDTVFNGTSMQQAREKLKEKEKQFDILYGCVFAEGKEAKSKVDIYFEDIYLQNNRICFYEWNVLQHYATEMGSMMFDMDGVLCKEPPDERNVAAYETYIDNAIPMVVPTNQIGAIVTYRLEKYRYVTAKWLERAGVSYGELIMFDATSPEQRHISPAEYKATAYKQADWATLFVESDRHQAEQICRISGKQVLCYENGQIYQ